ncbi:MAG: hypothetical protein HXY50_00760 [Ignavibacteriaceae bacterium]|nr:hypothetical protein [Ignavibacteriaceae bacterium]
MKKLFTNYNFEFDKNEKKLLATFCKQTLKQTESDSKFFAESKAFSAILEKLNSAQYPIKLTKDERTRLEHQLNENVKFIRKEIPKSGFIKKFLYKSMLKQYENILNKHFKN